MTQFVSAVHAVGHDGLVPLQTYAPHEGLPALDSGSGVHVPVAHDAHGSLHVALQHTPPAQIPLWH